jgi:chromosome segregation ATPase
MVMLAGLGFLTAALLTVFLSPLYRRRVERLTTNALKRAMPLTEAEIRADKDRLRAEYAIRIHKLEMKLEEGAEASARQMVEINRRDATISALEGEVSQQRASLEEHENARRVLEQTIMDRLPKVESRLAEARKLLFQRDREIVSLSQGSEKQARALEEATQINTQQTDEIHRLKAALNTRAARNREGINDPRFDGEVALRTEIEVLRSKTRNQAALISRLQALLQRGGPASEAASGSRELAGAIESNGAHEPSRPAKVMGKRGDTPALRAVKDEAEQAVPADAKVEAELRRLKSANEDQSAEIKRLKAALSTYEAADKDERGVKESKIALKAKLSALQALTDEQGGTIQSLRAEVASSNERLARQAAYFMEEMRRLGSDTVPASAPASRAAPQPAKRPLVDRINDPRVARLVRSGKPADNNAQKGNPRRVSGFLKALDGEDSEQPEKGGEGGQTAAASDAGGKEQKGSGDAKPSRKPRLLERITGLDKTSA